MSSLFYQLCNYTRVAPSAVRGSIPVEEGCPFPRRDFFTILQGSITAYDKVCYIRRQLVAVTHK